MDATSPTLDPLVLDLIVRRIVDVAKPDRVILFGSAVRDDMDRDSDVDLLVVKAGVPHRRRLAQEIHRAMRGVPMSVDVIVVTPDDLRRYGETAGSVLRPALREGREVYAA